MRVARLISLRDIHGLFICVRQLIHLCDTTHSCVRNDLLIYVIWLIHICNADGSLHFQNENSKNSNQISKYVQYRWIAAISKFSHDHYYISLSLFLILTLGLTAVIMLVSSECVFPCNMLQHIATHWWDYDGFMSVCIYATCCNTV